MRDALAVFVEAIFVHRNWQLALAAIAISMGVILVIGGIVDWDKASMESGAILLFMGGAVGEDGIKKEMRR